MRWVFILLALLVAALGVNKASTPAAPPRAETPLVLIISQTVGMTPFTLRVKVRAAAEGREVCVVVEGPESMQSCRVLDGITWTLDFTLRTGGTYAVSAYGQQYRTPALPVRVIGLNEGEP